MSTTARKPFKTIIILPGVAWDDCPVYAEHRLQREAIAHAVRLADTLESFDRKYGIADRHIFGVRKDEVTR